MKQKLNSVKHRKMNTFMMLVSGCGVGIAAALVSVAYRYSLGYAESFRNKMFESADTPFSVFVLFVILVFMGILVGFISKKEPMIKGSGIPQVKGQLLGYFSPSWLRVLVKKFIAGTLCILAGLSLGREGPSVQLGGMAAQGISEITGTDSSDSKYLIVCGACAGLAAAFNAPLAGLMFALEEIHRNFSRKAVFPAMAAAMCADVVSKLFFGTEAVLHMVRVDTLPLRYYLLYIFMGVICGAFGAFYNKTLFTVQKIYSKISKSDVVKITIPFAVSGIVGFTFPEIMGGGHGIIDMLSGGQLTLFFMVMLLIGKFTFSMISFCSGAPGGIFFPLLVLGALAGSIVGRAGVIVLGIPESYVINFMLLGMAGLFSGIVRAPLTGIVLVAEMSGSLTQFIGLAMVSCTAWLTAYMLKSRPVYDQMLDNMTPDSAGQSDDDYELVTMDIVIPYGSQADGKLIRNLNLPVNCHIVAIKRKEINLIPGGITAVRSGDILSIDCKAGTEKEVREVLGVQN